MRLAATIDGESMQDLSFADPLGSAVIAFHPRKKLSSMQPLLPPTVSVCSGI